MEFKLENVISSLLNNKKVTDLVKIMKPIGVVKILSKDLDLSPRDASRVALELIKKTGNVSELGIEPNMMYPVPSSIDKSGTKLLRFKNNEFDTDLKELGVPAGKTNITPKFTVKRHHFPPDPRNEPAGWPYDSATVSGMTPRNKQRKRPLMNAREPQKNIKYTFKNPLDTDLRINQPGGDGAGGGGIYSKSLHSKDNNLGTGGNSWTTTGYPGWSKSPSGKEFDDPNKKEATTNHPPNAGDEDDEPKFLKQPNTGVSYPIRLGFGGRSPPRLSPHGRTYGRR